ncbi:hypothetical protein EMPG_11446, partial [Blastomyces silverae]
QNLDSGLNYEVPASKTFRCGYDGQEKPRLIKHPPHQIVRIQRSAHCSVSCRMNFPELYTYLVLFSIGSLARHIWIRSRFNGHQGL